MSNLIVIVRRSIDIMSIDKNAEFNFFLLIRVAGPVGYPKVVGIF